MTKIVFISDFFADEIRGGAELCNDALIGLLRDRYTVETIKSAFVTPELLLKNLDSFFIIANFFMLPEPFKDVFAAKAKYVILEHDHKYVSSNNPSLYKDFLAPETQIINKHFYAAAQAVMCQSKKHASVVQKNLMLDNIVSLSGNIWTEEQLSVLENNLDTPKDIKFALAKEERSKVRKRTKDALAEIKRKLANGEIHISKAGKVVTKLGNPKNLTEEARKLSIEVRKKKADDNPNNKMAGAFTLTLRADGMTYKQIAAKLNSGGFTTSRGKEFKEMQVKRLIERYK